MTTIPPHARAFPAFIYGTVEREDAMMRCVVSATLALAAAAAAQAPSPYVEGDVPPAYFLQAAKDKQLFPETKDAYFHDVEKPRNTSMYGLRNATYWEADLDVDCDGKPSENCNKQRDPWFQGQLSASSTIQSEFTPHIVIPIGSPSNSKQRDILFGQVGAVIHGQSLVYGLLLDECGVKELIGEASYAAVKLLGVNPDPKNGGSDGPAHFFFFPGPSGRLANPSDWTDHAKVIAVGNARARQLMADHKVDWQASAALRPLPGHRMARALAGMTLVTVDGRRRAAGLPAGPGPRLLIAK